ncbi:TPA: DUF4365 domain-containing protein [Vibrio parahaemolyticus]|uniref:DUF4365 domain-containing protein n=1 Tax=Vibrio parahaemolyticus TaxID=670 RepID=UPI00042484C4|nr:DUF4365 domain-containing protein [Vibrio parahaemolyticus]KIT46472.1 hypothetical protein H337_07060 [Vibrio parahaemolyticus EN9701121]
MNTENMNPGEIGEAAGRIFSFYAPLNWIIRSQEDQNDHGIDLEIELKNAEGIALGQESVFKIQLKGQKSCSYIDDGQKLSFSVPRTRVEYYLQFNIPVIFVVVDVSTECIYWISVTDNAEIQQKLDSSDTASLTIHLPIENQLERGNTDSFNKMLSAVQGCWEHLSLRGLRTAVTNCRTLEPEALDQRIDQVGDALFTAYHAKFEQLLENRNFSEVYQQADTIIRSPIVPSKDRFIATLYFDYSFKVAPFTNLKQEQIEQQMSLCSLLIGLAREQKETPYRLTAIAKTRTALFTIMTEQLHANHVTHPHFQKDSIEYLLMNQEIHKHYVETCRHLVKIINLCNRLITRGQFSILADLMVDLMMSIGEFKTVHKARGADGAIAFLDDWLNKMLSNVLFYTSKVSDLWKINQLYLMINLQENLKSLVAFDIRELVLEHCPNAEDMLNALDEQITNKPKSFLFADASVEEQKAFFADMAKRLGMDPDDEESREGQFVSIGLKNYDPTNVISHCEHMFVDYRPRGMIAEQLRMHSLCMPLMTCLKHGHAVTTGRSLIEVFDNSDGPEFMRGFKQTHCDNCNDCTPRTAEWCWSLKWHGEERIKHAKKLDKFKNF